MKWWISDKVVYGLSLNEINYNSTHRIACVDKHQILLIIEIKWQNPLKTWTTNTIKHWPNLDSIKGQLRTIFIRIHATYWLDVITFSVYKQTLWFCVSHFRFFLADYVTLCFWHAVNTLFENKDQQILIGDFCFSNNNQCSIGKSTEFQSDFIVVSVKQFFFCNAYKNKSYYVYCKIVTIWILFVQSETHSPNCV